MSAFITYPGFCSFCGSILPDLRSDDEVICYNCKKQYRPEVFGEQETEYTIHFNSFEPEKIYGGLKLEEEMADGPTVERKCPKCGCDKMAYATLQLRSADEGQTVFFTCIKCKYKESENS